MSWPAQLAALARYNRWMNRRLYALAAELTEDERRRDLGAFFGSVHGTLGHILLGDRAWLGRLADPALGVSRDAAGQPIAVRSLAQDLYPDFAALRREREATDEGLLAWVSGLDEARLDAKVAYKTFAGVAFEMPLWQPLTHMLNHGTHHRGQVTTLLKQLGRDPGVTDLVAMLREESDAGLV